MNNIIIEKNIYISFFMGYYIYGNNNWKNLKLTKH